jgi:hypothetical protein
MEPSRYLTECRVLSLTARAMVALLIIERFCIEHSISNAEIDKFLAYMWRWPEIDGPDKFGPWEACRPELVNFGLGSDMPLARLFPFRRQSRVAL